MPLYFMPMATGSGVHAAQLAPFGVAQLRYGGQPFCLAASACDAATDASVTANADVRRAADDLDSVPVAIEDLRTYLEGYHVPADWLDGQQTWHSLLRGVLGIFLFVQRYQGEGGGPPIFANGVTLETTLSALPSSVQQALRVAADNQGFDGSVVQGPASLRSVLRAMGQQWGDRPILMGTVTL